MLNQERGTIATLFANFLTLDGQEASTVTDVKITIRHIDAGGATITDINEATMNFAIETLYYFKWNIPLTAELGVYTIEYSAIVDGEYAEANESLQLLEFTGGSVCTDTYTTAEKVAEYLGVTADKINADWLEWATRYIEMYTCTKFCPVTRTEKQDIEKTNQSELFLEFYPILNVIELRNDGVVVEPSDYLVYLDEGRIAFADDFMPASSIIQSAYFTRGRQKVQIMYTYGYSALPKEIEWAATVLVSTIASTSLQQSGTTSVGDVSEEQIGEYRIKRSTSTTGAVDFSSSIEESKLVDGRLEEDVFSVKNILKSYKLMRIRAV